MKRKSSAGPSRFTYAAVGGGEDHHAARWPPRSATCTGREAEEAEVRAQAGPLNTIAAEVATVRRGAGFSRGASPAAAAVPTPRPARLPGRRLGVRSPGEASRSCRGGRDHVDSAFGRRPPHGRAPRASRPPAGDRGGLPRFHHGQDGAEAAVRVAVTGGNGLIGGEAVRQLAGRHEVLALGRGPCRLGQGAHAWADADLGDGRSVEAALLAFRPEAVLHAGAATDVDGCERDPDLAWRVNVGGVRAGGAGLPRPRGAARGGLDRLRVRRQRRAVLRGRRAEPAGRLRPHEALRGGGGAAPRARLRRRPRGGGLRRKAGREADLRDAGRGEARSRASR